MRHRGALGPGKLPGTAALLLTSIAAAAPVSPPEGRRPQTRPAPPPKQAPPPTRVEVETFLESETEAPEDEPAASEPLEAPPRPPRERGIVVGTTVGALGHLGEMQHISPTAPWFHVQLGWDIGRWVTLLALTDVAFATTSYARPPPDPRGYALYAFGIGARVTFDLGEWYGLFLQGELGVAEVSEDVLSSYGYDDADSLNPYFGANAGFKWYQVSPHYALVAHAGVRNYTQLLDRQLSSSSPWAWIAAAGLEYTF